VRETLGFLERLTLEPDAIGPGDVERVRAAGVSDEALADAIRVCALFNTIDRIADALGFDVPPDEAFAARAPAFLEGGYRLPAPR
jgi:alkylhydroperoxidase family enzyme